MKRSVERFPAAEAEIEAISASIQALETADHIVALRSLEADGANGYWNAWRSIELTFVRKDEARVPPHWHNFPSRRSWIAGTGPRSAGCPVNALLNLGYALGELEARLVCMTMGLDPGLGVLHTVQAARDSLALDVLEGIRPDIDRWVLETVETHAFRKADFYETRRGVFRVGTDLARAMAETLPTWRCLLAPIVEGCAMAFASSSDKPLRVATKLTETRRIQGRGKMPSRPLQLSACRECGAILADSDRTICDECLPDYDRDRAEKLASAGKSTLAAMRASCDDPARSPEATAKKREKSRSTSLAMRSWEREHGRGDPEKYEREVLPTVEQMTVPMLMKVTSDADSSSTLSPTGIEIEGATGDAVSGPLASYELGGFALYPNGIGTGSSVSLEVGKDGPQLFMDDAAGHLRIALGISKQDEGPTLYFFPKQGTSDDEAPLILSERNGDPYLVMRNRQPNSNAYSLIVLRPAILRYRGQTNGLPFIKLKDDLNILCIRAMGVNKESSAC